jgi:hypothetical protein
MAGCSNSTGGKIMTELEGGIIVGILGQWASGKSTAAKTLVSYLGGEGDVVFLTDFVCYSGQAVNHILELEETMVTTVIEDDGRRRLQGKVASVWLRPGEDLETVDLHALNFDVNDDVAPAWLNRARVELGHQICERSAEGKPIVVEAAYGENPVGHTIADLFVALDGAGAKPKQVKWIIVEAGFERRSERNAKRRIGPPADVFDRYAVDGGGLDRDHQTRLEEQGAAIIRVANDHDDVDRFKAEVIAAFDEMFPGALPEKSKRDLGALNAAFIPELVKQRLREGIVCHCQHGTGAM